MTTKPKKNEFKLPKLVIVEGEDDAHFIFKFLQFVDSSLLKKIHIHWVCGNSKLYSGHRIGKDGEMLGLKQMLDDANFRSNVGEVAVIFDAETSSKKSFDSIINQCKEANKVAKEKTENGARVKMLNLPTKVGQLASQKPDSMTANLSVFLFDIGDGTGTLEDLYLSTLEDEEKALIQDCIGKMIKCAENKVKKIDSKKVKTQSFLAIKDPTLKSIGFAATEERINFERGLIAEDSPLNLLKNFLLDFSKL